MDFLTIEKRPERFRLSPHLDGPAAVRFAFIRQSARIMLCGRPDGNFGSRREFVDRHVVETQNGAIEIKVFEGGVMTEFRGPVGTVPTETDYGAVATLATYADHVSAKRTG